MQARFLLLLPLLFGCASEPDDPPEDAGDGKYHPPPNGVRTSEDQACAALQSAVSSHAMALGCSLTVRPCPQLLRVQFQTPCMQYDEGSVTGCVEFYQSKASCPELVVEDCMVTPYPGSEPAGCPP